MTRTDVQAIHKLGPPEDVSERFEHVSRFELVRGEEVRLQLPSKIPEGAEVDPRTLPPDHPIRYRIETGVLWAEVFGEIPESVAGGRIVTEFRSERVFLAVQPCELEVTSRGKMVAPGGWRRALVSTPAPNGSRYSPKFHGNRAIVRIDRADAFVRLATGDWTWATVCEAFGPPDPKKSDPAEDPWFQLNCGAGESIVNEFRALPPKLKGPYLSKVAEVEAAGAYYTAEDFLSPESVRLFEDGVGSFIGTRDFARLHDAWKALRPETILGKSKS